MFFAVFQVYLYILVIDQRIIPATAGQTRPSPPARCPSEDHSRECGGKPTDRNVEDMLQAALGDGYPRSVGHGNGYFSLFRHVCGEPWAEIMDAQIANPNAYALIEKYFPKSVTIFNEMVKEALK